MSDEQYEELSNMLQDSISEDEFIQAVRACFYIIKNFLINLFSYNWNIFIIHQ